MRIMRTTYHHIFKDSSWLISCIFLLFYSLFVFSTVEANTVDALIAKAQNGSIEDQYKLGKKYLDRKDYKNARQWLSKAAEQGSVKAQTKMGWLYENGKGVKKDYGVAFSWYEKAAEQGYGNAQRPLGKLYELGQGVDPSPEKAFYWYEKAAQQGISRAQANLGILYETGSGVDRDYQKALFWYTKTANKGYPRGQYLLGKLYERGLGVEKDRNVAEDWYRKSAASKYSRAVERLKILKAQGPDDSTVNPTEATSLSIRPIKIKPKKEKETAPKTESQPVIQSSEDSSVLKKTLPDMNTLDTDQAITTARYHFVKGNDLFNNGKMNEAIEEYNKALIYNPGSANTLANLGIAYAELGQFDDAIKVMHDAIDANPNNSKTYAALGMMLHYNQKEKEALAQYKNAIKNDPTLANIYTNMAFIFAKSNDYIRAWKSVYMADFLGFPNKELREILLSESKEPEVSWPDDENGYYLRQIIVSTKERAQEIRKQLEQGANFSAFVKSDSLEQYRENGGYIGYLDATEITPETLELIKNIPPLSYSDILETDKGFHIFQRLMVLKELYANND